MAKNNSTLPPDWEACIADMPDDELEALRQKLRSVGSSRARHNMTKAKDITADATKEMSSAEMAALIVALKKQGGK